MYLPFGDLYISHFDDRPLFQREIRADKKKGRIIREIVKEWGTGR